MDFAAIFKRLDAVKNSYRNWLNADDAQAEAMHARYIDCIQDAMPIIVALFQPLVDGGMLFAEISDGREPAQRLWFKLHGMYVENSLIFFGGNRVGGNTDGLDIASFPGYSLSQNERFEIGKRAVEELLSPRTRKTVELLRELETAAEERGAIDFVSKLRDAIVEIDALPDGPLAS